MCRAAECLPHAGALATCRPSPWRWAAMRLSDDHSHSYGENAPDDQISVLLWSAQL